MPKYLIADFIVEIEPKFDYLKKLCEPFLYEGERSADFSAIPSDSYLNSLLSRMVEGSTIDEAEEFASEFATKTIEKGKYLRFDYFASEYRRRMRSDRQVLSSQEPAYQSIKLVSLYELISHDGDDETRFIDIVRSDASEHGESRAFEFIDWAVAQLLRSTSCDARRWAIREFEKHCERAKQGEVWRKKY